MDKKQKNILSFIISLLVMIIIILILLTTIKNNNKVENENYIQNENSYLINNIGISEEDNDYIVEFKEKIEYDNKIEYVQDNTNFFTINALYSNYINSVGNKEKEVLNNILAKKYKVEYKITDNNIFNKLSIPELTNNTQYYKPTITEMLTVQINDRTHIYIIKGKCRIGNMDNMILDVNAMFEVDTIENTYIVYPDEYMQDKGYINLKAGDIINHEVSEQEKNNYNTYERIYKTDKELSILYFNNYKELLLYYPDEAYNRLDSEYSNKRFGSKENFQEYLKENATFFSFMEVDKYKIESNGTYTEYICSDEYNNIYIIRQQDGVMRYSIFLDNYTIITKVEAKYYDELEKNDKVAYNVQKFINMVNSKDYNAIYNVLDITFKNNNFKDIDTLKQYLKDNLYEINSIEIEDFDDETYEYYVFTCKVTNAKNTDQTKNMTIIINQSEGTEFTMSFSLI